MHCRQRNNSIRLFIFNYPNDTVMKEKDPFDFSLVFVFNGTQEGIAVLNASRQKTCTVFTKVKVCLLRMVL